MLRYFVGFESIDELRAVDEMLANLRKMPKAAGSNLVGQSNDPLADRIAFALTHRPLTSFEEALLDILFKADEWVPYQTVLAELEAGGLSSNKLGPNKEASEADHKASNALRLLSRRMKEHLLPSDIAGKSKPIEALASRTKIADRGFCYRLTPPGRAAVSTVLS